MSLRVLNSGGGISVQDEGRLGWKRFGVPPGGPMDRHSAALANELAGNPPTAPLLELCLAGMEFEVVADCRVAVAGAGILDPVGRWSGGLVRRGQRLVVRDSGEGLWTYLAVAGGVRAERFLGSASAAPRLGIGFCPKAGDILDGNEPDRLASSISRRFLISGEIRDFKNPPALTVWPGPEWHRFSKADRAAFFETAWEVSPRSDRSGYRLTGPQIGSAAPLSDSEPVLVGSIQVPPSGSPVVLMPDGPTVGGYPKIGWIDRSSLDWLAQCRPGVAIRFCPR